MKSVIIIGTGGIGKRHIRGFLKTGRVLLSVCEPDSARREEVCRDYDIQKDFSDIEQVDLSSYDAAVICAPAHVHIKLGQQCADAGIPFLVEKPLAVTMDGVDRLIETVNEKNLPVRVAYVRRSSPEAIAFRKHIMEGKIGEVKMCYMNASQEFPKYRPDYQRIYYAKEAMGGGAILDCASHFIDFLIWLMGPIKEVSSMYDRLVLEGVECEDCALITLRFQSGSMAQINMNQFQKPLASQIEMIGTLGNLILDGKGKILFANDDSGKWEEEDAVKGYEYFELHEARFGMQANMFLDGIEGNPCHLTTLEEARDNLRVALAAKESYRTMKIVRL